MNGLAWKWVSIKVVLCLWLFNLFIDGVMREIRETTGEIGVRLKDDEGKHEWIIEWLKFANDTLLLGR